MCIVMLSVVLILFTNWNMSDRETRIFRGKDRVVTHIEGDDFVTKLSIIADISDDSHMAYQLGVLRFNLERARSTSQSEIRRIEIIGESARRSIMANVAEAEYSPYLGSKIMSPVFEHSPDYVNIKQKFSPSLIQIIEISIDTRESIRLKIMKVIPEKFHDKCDWHHNLAMENFGIYQDRIVFLDCGDPYMCDALFKNKDKVKVVLANLTKELL